MKFISFLLLITFNFNAYTCEVEFPLKDQWLGGDAVYSIDISETKTIWMFGDTFVGSNKSRRETQMIGNSVGVSTCENGKWNIQYYWNEATGEILPSNKYGDRIWPKDGYFYNGKLYLTGTPAGHLKDAPFGFNFKVYDTTLYEISNPFDEPNKWKIKETIWFEGTSILGASAIVTKGKYIYQFAKIQISKPVVALLRSPIDNPTKNIEIFQENKWIKLKDARQQKAFGKKSLIPSIDGADEFSVHQDPKTGLWELTILGQFLQSDVVKYTASSLTGPWKKDGIAFSFYEYTLGIKGVFCYASKFHLKYSVYTYVCNSNDEKTLLDDLSIYRPIVVKKGP